MATRGCIIELKKDVCKIGYLHYGADFASKFIWNSYIDSNYLERIFELDREWEKREEYEGIYYQEITDAETIEKLHKYDMDVIDMDAEVFIFLEHKPATDRYIELYDMTIRRSLSVEDEEWEYLSQEDKDKEMKFIRTCVGID